MPGLPALTVMTACLFAPLTGATGNNSLKTEVIASVDAPVDALAKRSEELWGYAGAAAA
ncbi:hypothetical protein [Pseudohaliea rubra]|uniref:Uncharacterized protein n=1 Tax=Pseudohaliea rubra DSM 19751 TaxID=1265313 RepID=A0A095VR48_9GAMM|nr:hypothetical protein [Pseudohaliea rubra]KGE03855.1 hypothetical protein HRUBRA_01602 [Pseudohaliea rubra DSM 19751]